MRLHVRELGLAAYLRIKNVPFVGRANRGFDFDSELTEDEWRTRYYNSECYRHDQEVMSLKLYGRREFESNGGSG